MKPQLCQGCREGRHSDHYSLPLVRADGTKWGECRCDRCVKTTACLCGHPQARHRGDTDSAGPVGCLDCVCELFEPEITPTKNPESPVKTYKPHPAAELFPMMSSDELDQLATDITERGQLQPIVITSDHLVLDGRNRLEACRRAKVEPVVVMWDREDNDASPTAWVLSANLRRRHLTESQKAMVAVDSLKLFQAEAKARQKESGGDRRSVSAPGRQPIQAEDEGWRTGAEIRAAAAVAKKVGAGKATAAAAKAIGVGTRSVERAKALVEKAPKAELEKIRTGEKTIKQVERETKRAEQVAQVRVYQPPAGQFGVIVVDFPWRYDDTLDGSDASRGGCPYPTMSIEEICAMPLPVAEDCATFMWITNSHLIDPSAYAVVARAWAERYDLHPKQIQTWVKTRMGLGRVWRNNTEHLVRFERGRPVFNPVTQTTSLVAPAGEHSAKPDLAYELIEALCASPSRIELFARTDRKGWVTTGAELGKKRLDGKAAQAEDQLEVARAMANAPTHVEGRDFVELPRTPKPKRRLLIKDFPEVAP